MSRERLPSRRRCFTQKVRINDTDGVPQTFYLTTGEYPDGRLGEIFIEAHKEGTFARGVLSALARMTWMALQYGADVRDIVHALRHLNFPPRGVVEGSAATELCSSVPDWIAQELDAHYLNKVSPEDTSGGEGGN